jgi:cellulose synthase/poly-beta-1,6-N-acetylglucosamine synthase-like glycosyltransferase
VAALAFALSVALFLAWAHLFALGVRTRRALIDLGGAPPPGPFPALTVVVPCRDEARGVDAAVRSLLAQDLPDLQVVAVDDRSTDGTGELLDRLAARDARLEVIHVAALPPGWLGKNHACAAGARRARGGWILFTDGDVVFAPGALRRALGAATARRLGHLAVAPTFVAPGFAERAFVTAFAALLAPALRLWELPRAGTRAFFGVGAFNLVRRDAYEAAGGHARIPLEVVDDVKLGLLLRRSGVPQGAAASGLVSVRWQHGLAPSVAGLVKNAFAAVEYRLPVALAGAAGLLLLGAGPVVLAAAAPSAAARGVALAALAVSVLHHARWARAQAGARGAEGLLMPACATVLGAVLLGSALAARARGAVLWRGTRYPLDEVRSGCLRIADLSPARAAAWPAPDETPATPQAHACDGIGPSGRRLR